MTIIKITPCNNGAHENQTILGVTPEAFPLPEGWALLPASMGAPEDLENFPFGEISVASVGSVPTVTSWTPLPIPELPHSVQEAQEAASAS